MDNAGKNRYELLFMDDDVSDPLDNNPTKKKQQQPQQHAKAPAVGASSKSANAVAAKAQPANKKQPNHAEKENKPLAMNKNEANKRAAAVASGSGLNNGRQQQQGVAGNNNNNNNNRKRNAGGPTTGEVASQGRNVNFRQQNGETREQRNNRRNARENGPNNHNNHNNHNNNAGGGGGATEGGQQQRQFRDRGDNRGAVRQRNFEGGNNHNREFRGKREHDRQSGSDKTGVKAVDKREGAGPYNWGSVKEGINDMNKANDTHAERAAAAAEKAGQSSNEHLAEATPVEEQTKELTLDEWKAQKQQRVKPKYNIRKAGEGEDTSQWKKMVALNNTKKKEIESEEELEYDPAMYPQRVGRQQRVLDIQFNFNDGRRSGFGGRGRGRGGQRAEFAGSRAGQGAGERGPRGEATGERNVGGSAAAAGAGSSGAQQGARGGRGGGGGFEGGRNARAGAGAGKRNSGGDSNQNTVPKVNDERQFPTLA